MKLKLKNPFKRIGLRLTTIFVLVAAIPVATVGFYSLTTSTDTLLEAELSAHENHLKSQKQSIEDFLSGAKSDVLFLAGSGPMRQYLHAATGRDKSAKAKTLKILEDELLAFARQRKIYYQVRYLDETGQEIARADYDGKRATLRAKEKLQNKGKSYYFKRGSGVGLGNVFVSDLDLNKEQGKVEVPHKPVIRYVTPVRYPDGRRAGTVVANLNGKAFLDPLGASWLVDKGGFYLNHVDEKKRWGGKNDLNTGTSFKKDQPHHAKKVIGAGKGTLLDEDAGHGMVYGSVKVPGTAQTWTLITQFQLDELFAPVNDFRVIFFGILGGALGITLLLGFFSARGITKPLTKLLGAVHAIGEGNLDVRTEIKTGDELQELGDAFDDMVAEKGKYLLTEEENEMLNNSVISILRSVSKLGKGDLTVQVPVNEDITGALGDAINQMSEGMSKTLGQVNAASDQVRLTSAEAKSVTEKSKERVLDTAKGMGEIRGTIQETAKRIKRLGERSQEISGIVKIIDDIAERTNVLALNANMQAAQAGEAGRGFMVVADEVQRLAESSKEATDQISKLVAGIQAETGDTIATMDKAIEEVVQGGELAEQAAAHMDETEQTVTRLDALGAQLAQAVGAFTLPESDRQGQAKGPDESELLKAVG